MAADPSPTHLLVLRRLRRTPAKDLLRTALGELVDGGVLVVEAHEVARGRRNERRLVLRDGAAPAPRGGGLARVAAALAAAPAEVVEGRPARDVAAVAGHLARQGGLRREVLSLVLGELEAAGWVATEERRLLGLLRRLVSVRTAAGEGVLAAAGPDQDRRRASSDGAAAVGTGGDAGPRDDPRDEFDPTFDAGFDGGAASGDGGDGGGGDGGGGGGGD